MKSKVLFVVLGFSLTSILCVGRDMQDSVKRHIKEGKDVEEPPKKTRIGFNYLKGVTTLELAPPGVILHRTLVLGAHKLEDDGFRFTPLTTSPERLPQENFERHFWYNSLVKELFVPYTEIKTVKTWGGIILKTKNGKRYKVHMKHYKAVADELRSKIKNP